MYVGREVIVAAGAIGSPKVLELSGVGNSTYVGIFSLSFFLFLLQAIYEMIFMQYSEGGRSGAGVGPTFGR